MEKKSNKKEVKRMDKSLVITVSLCLAVVVFIIGAIVIPEPVIAAIELNKAREFIEGSDGITVVINAPMESGGLLTDAESVLDESRSKAFSDSLLNILKNVKYTNTNKVNNGIWKTNIVIYNTTDKLCVYIDENGIYLEKGQSVIAYAISENVRSEYDALYNEVLNLLKQ